MLELEPFFERGATALESSLLWFLDDVMDLMPYFDFTLTALFSTYAGKWISS